MVGGYFIDKGSEKTAYINFYKHFNKLGYTREEIYDLWAKEKIIGSRSLEDIDKSMVEGNVIEKRKKRKEVKKKRDEEEKENTEKKIYNLFIRLNGLRFGIQRIKNMIENYKNSSQRHKVEDLENELKQKEDDMMKIIENIKLLQKEIK